MKIAALIGQHPEFGELIPALQSADTLCVRLQENVEDPEIAQHFIGQLSDHAPDVILVDAGFWTRNPLNSEIRQQCPEHAALVLLMTENCPSTATQLFAEFDVDSVISAPFSQAQITVHLESALNQRKSMLNLNRQVADANSTAMAAMTTMSEMGCLVQMFEALECAGTYESIMDCVFNVCASLDLKAVAQIIDHNDQFFFPPDAVTDSLREILTSASMADVRIISQKRIMILRTDHFVLLITNAPWEDEARYGRLRDLLIQVATIVDAKIRTVIVNRLINHQHIKVMSIMSMLRKLTVDTQQNTREIMRKLSEDLEVSALTLDLNEHQENHLLKLSEKALGSLESLYTANDVVEAHFHQLVSSFSQIKALTAERTHHQGGSNASNAGAELF